MAEKALQKVEDELTTCSICLGTYTNPKLLQCFHAHCQGCLAKAVRKDVQGQLILICPDCRQVTPVPAGGVADIQPAFHINRLLGIMEEHRKGKDECSAHTENSSPSIIPQAKVTPYCSEHPDEEVKLYCETCEKLICVKCVIKDGEHHDHDNALLDQAFEKYKEKISSLLQPMEKQMATVKQARQQLHTCRGKINDQQATIEADIHSTIGRLQEILEVRKTQLIRELHQITQIKLKSLTAHDEQLETKQVEVGSCLDFMKKSMEKDNCSDVLKMKTRIIKRVEELTAPFQPNLLKPCTDADLAYSTSATTLDGCQNYGQLLGSHLVDPSICYAIGKGLEIANIEEKSTVILHAVNRKGEPCVQLISSLVQCELISEILPGNRVLGSVKDLEQNKYEISYQPTIKGRHHLHIKVEGQHIKGSPFKVAVKSSIHKLGTSFHSIRGVDGPCGVALTHKRKLVVSGHRDHHIHVFGPDGKKLSLIGSHGSGKGQFEHPAGVTVDKDGNILVVDRDNHRVQKFTAKGQFIKAVGSKGKKSSKFDYPCGIAFNTSNSKVYVADTNNHRVQVLNSDLTFFASFGNHGSDKGQFSHLRCISCDRSGLVYVGDTSNNRVQVFRAEGRFLREFGHQDLKEPLGITTDSNNMVYVSEGYNHRVSVFTPEGEFVKAFGGEGSSRGLFQCPNGLAVDKTGVVYVCDMNNNRIQKF